MYCNTVISDLVAKPGPVLLLYGQTLRIPRQIRQGVLIHTIEINSTKDGMKQRTQVEVLTKMGNIDRESKNLTKVHTLHKILTNTIHKIQTGLLLVIL